MFISAVESVASNTGGFSVAKVQKFNRDVTSELTLDLRKTVHLGSGMTSGLCESAFREFSKLRRGLARMKRSDQFYTLFIRCITGNFIYYENYIQYSHL